MAMTFTYKPLMKLLIDRDMKKLDLVEMGLISRGTLARLSKNESVSMDTIAKICDALDCDITDVVEFKRDAERD